MRWKNKPAGSNWGDFGPDDQLGRPNLIGAEQVLKGAREIRAGLSFCLSLPLDFPGDSKLNVRRHPPVLRPTFKDGLPYVNFPFARNEAGATDVVSDDQVLLSLQYSTQNTRKKICMVAYTPYEADNRVRRYAETLVKRGDQVDVIAISGAHVGRRDKYRWGYCLSSSAP